MISRRNRFVLLLLLTLLQCFAPLLHAHTLGLGQDGGVAHLHEVDDLHADVLGGDHTVLEHAHATESPAIGIAQEYREDHVLALNDAEPAVPASSFQFPLLFRQPLLEVFNAAPPGVSRPHTTPFSQAPPTNLV